MLDSTLCTFSDKCSRPSNAKNQNNPDLSSELLEEESVSASDGISASDDLAATGSSPGNEEPVKKCQNRFNAISIKTP